MTDKSSPTTATDAIFQVDQIQEDFVFNDRVAQVFDDMLDRSVPCYQDVIHAIARILKLMLQPDDTVTDLGCATGSTLLQLSGLLEKKHLRFFGIDNSPAMLNRAKLKAELFSKQDRLHFLCDDITTVNQPETSAFLLNYTLQFIRPLNRADFLQHIFANLRPGGLLILSEKIISHHPGINRRYIDIYHQFKKERGYSELEIAKKREALENVLIPCSHDENRTLLRNAGFVEIEPFFQWFNFVSFLAVKPTT